MPGGTTLIGTVVAALGFVLSAWAGAHAVLYKRKPQSAFAWIALVFAVPFVGVLLYYTFGINRVRTRAKALLLERPERPPPASQSAGAPPGLEPLAELGFAVTGLPLVSGNAVDVLHNGEGTFPAMLAAIRAARNRVFLSTYIFDSGPVGQEFVDALAEAVARGVDVRVAIDGVGALYSWPQASAGLARRGVRVAKFLPPRLLPPSFSVNLRNHRKVLAVDGQVAFTGGINIREHYLAAETDVARRIVDLHFRIAGPVVAQMEAVFLRDWRFMTGEKSAVSPSAPEARGTALCRAVADGPEEDLDRLTELLVGAIGKARRRVAIMTPYFLPPREIMAPLAAAALQGVDVAVILPARNNLPYVHRATRHMLWELLQRNVRVYYQPPPFAHSKLYYTDDHYAQIGSANLDTRSLRLNFEMNVEVYDEALVGTLSRHFEAARARSVPITLADVDGRPFATKLVDGAAWLFSPYL
jgi:cardiolipin synthase A/B